MEAKKLVNEQSACTELTKALGLFESITIVIGMVIGSGIFFKPSIVFKNTGDPGLGLLAWLAGGIITIAAGLTIAEIGAAILGTLWAYDGWINVASMAGEMKNPGRDLPKAIVIGLAVVMIAYIGVNIAAINVLPTGTIVTSKKAASDVAIALFGKSGGAFVTAGILVSIFGALNGWVLTGPRVPLAMAHDGLLPFQGFFGKVSEKYGTPINASIFQFVIASLFVITGSFDMITNLVVFVVWIFFMMGMAGIFILRSKHQHLERPYKVPLFPITPAVGLIGGTYIVISTLLTDTTNALLGLAITILGIPVYVYLYKKSRA